MNINDFVKTEHVRGVIESPQATMKAQMSDWAWQELMQANEQIVPQSMAVKITYGGHVYKGVAHLVQEIDKKEE